MRTSVHPRAMAAGLVCALLLFSLPAALGQTGPVLPAQATQVLNGLTPLVVTNTAVEANIPPGQESLLLPKTNHLDFTYPNREALLADGWSFLATQGGVTRNTEVTNAADGFVIDYDQTAHPGTINLPCDIGDFFEISNNRAHPARNFLTRELPANWLEINLTMTFTPGTFIQQAGIGLYQDDDNYNWMSLAYADWRPSHMLADGSPDDNPVNGGGGDPVHREVWAIEMGGILPQSVFSPVYCPHTHLYPFFTDTHTLKIDKTTTNYWCPTCVQGWWSPWPGYFGDVGDPGQLTGYSYPPQLTNPRVCVWAGCLPPAVPGSVNMVLHDFELVSLEPAFGLTYRLLTAPAGATITTNGIISWTPTRAQLPSTNLFTTIVSDNNSPPASATNSFTVIVQDLNVAPVLPAQADRMVSLPSTLTVTNTATEADPNALPLSYLLLTAPPGATIDTNGIISWAPSADLIYTTNLFVTVVTNYDPLASNAKSLSATNSFNVMVLPPPYPVLPSQPGYTVRQFNTLIVTNAAADGALTVTQIVTNILRFNYANRAALLADGWSFVGNRVDGSTRDTEYPAGAGQLDYNQAAHPGVLNIPCDIGDLYQTGPVVNNTRNSLFRTLPADWLSVRLALSFAPVTANYQQAHLSLYQDDDNYVQMGVAFNSSDGNERFTLDSEVRGVTATPTKTQTTSTSLNFRLDRNSTNSTVTAYYSLDGATWTTLGTVNLALNNPRLAIWTGSYQLPYGGGGAVMGLQRLDIVTEGPVPTALSYRLLNPPAGATIDSHGVISWTPNSAIVPGPYVLTTVVTDNGLPPLSATNGFTVQVTAGHTGPSLPGLPNLTIAQYSTLRVTNTATDTDIPFTGLTYSLLSAPNGAWIDANGVITWTPSAGQGHTTNVFTTVATDGATPALSATNSFAVAVNEINLPPVLGTPANQTLAVHQALRVTNAATAADMPPVTLSYQLFGPTGSAIDGNGVITWTPLLTDASSTNLFKTVVTDLNPWAVNEQALSATNTFLVTVLPPPPPPTLKALYQHNGELVLSWEAATNQSYRLQYCDDLRSNNWQSVTPDVTATGSTLTLTNPVNSTPARFFRLLLLP